MDDRSVVIGYALGYNDGLNAGSSGGGGSDDDKWVYPDHWLPLPDPAENQIIMLVEVNDMVGLYSPVCGAMTTYTKTVGAAEVEYTRYGATTIDWGDGSIDYTIGGEFKDTDLTGVTNGELVERGLLKQHLYGTAGQYIVTITFNDDVKIASIVNSTSGGDNTVKAIKVGLGSIFAGADYDKESLVYLKFLGDTSKGEIEFKSYCALVYVECIGIYYNPGFEGCYSLKYINFGDIATTNGSLRNNAFLRCSSLKTINLGSNIKSIGTESFRYCYSLQKISGLNVTSIKRYTFSECNSLETIDFPKLQTMEDMDFLGCYALKKIDFPNLKEVKDYAFGVCTALEIANLPNVTSISKTAFLDCHNLRKLVLAENCNLNGNTIYEVNPQLPYKQT